MLFYYLIPALLASPSIAEKIVLTSNEVLNTPFRELLGRDEDPSDSLFRRQEVSDALSNANLTTSGVIRNPDGSLNLTAWDMATNAACVEALGNAAGASNNPSGNSACYNLPSLDIDTGVFEAELRLYKVAEPRGGFVDVSPEEISVAVSIRGADISEIEFDDGAAAPGNVTTAGLDLRKRLEEPELIQSYLLVGQIHPDEMRPDLTIAELETLLMPTLTLTVATDAGARVTTNVSANEGAFLIGVFSQSIVLSDFAAAQQAVDEAIAGIATGDTAFILPGTHIMIFPIGGIITGVWALVGFAAYGFGTFERMQYADSFRRQKSASAFRT